MNFRSDTLNQKLLIQAFSVLRGNWVKAIAGFAIMLLLEKMVSKYSSGLGAGLQCIILSIISSPLFLGAAIFALALSRRQNPRIWQILTGFKRFGTALYAHVLILIFILLWALLLIVPGIVAAIAYCMTYYILADNPDMGALEAIRRSKAMMMGNKWKCACFSLGLGCLAIPMVIPAYILSQVDMATAIRMPFYAVTILCNLLLTAYTEVSFAQFYDDLKPVPIFEEPSVAEPSVPVAEVNTSILDALCTNQKN